MVYDIADDDARYLRSALTNIDNQIEAAKTGRHMVVVVHGPGLALLQQAKRNADLRRRITARRRAGVSFRVGARSLKRQHLDYRRDLFDVAPADVVPNGIAELVRLQELGFVYVKP